MSTPEQVRRAREEFQQAQRSFKWDTGREVLDVKVTIDLRLDLLQAKEWFDEGEFFGAPYPFEFITKQHGPMIMELGEGDVQRVQRALMAQRAVGREKMQRALHGGKQDAGPPDA